jgi:hypothetical protein
MAMHLTALLRRAVAPRATRCFSSKAPAMGASSGDVLRDIHFEEAEGDEVRRRTIACHDGPCSRSAVIAA